MRAATRAAVGSHVTMKMRQAEMAAEKEAAEQAPSQSALSPHLDPSALFYRGKMSLMTRFFLFLGNPLISIGVAVMILLAAGAFALHRRVSSAASQAPALAPQRVAASAAPAGFGRRR